jgi:hypothetical protein
MKHSTYSRRCHTVSTVKKSQATIPGGLLAQEHPPGAVGSPWCRVEPMAAKRGTDRGRRDPNPEVLQFALDALVAPAWVRLGQPDDQLLHLRVQRRPTGLAVWVNPAAGDQAPMPAQQRGSEQARPAGSGQHPAGCGEQRPVGGLQPESWGLPAQDGELMAWHQDLQVLDGAVMGEQGEELDGSGTAIDRRGSATTRTASEVGSGTALPYPDGLLQLRSSWAPCLGFRTLRAANRQVIAMVGGRLERGEPVARMDGPLGWPSCSAKPRSPSSSSANERLVGLREHP